MSNAALADILDRWMGPDERDLDSSYLTRFLSLRDEDAFAALVRRHGPLVFGTCVRVLGNRDEADDAFQAVFFVLARRAHTLDVERGIGPWLYGVALRVAKKLRVQIARRKAREQSAAKPERVEAAESERDFWAVVDEELARMSRPHREVLLLCDLGGQSHSRTAKSMGLAKGTITKRLATAREELAARLRHRGVTLGVGTLSATVATRACASAPASLFLETAKQAVAYSTGRVGGRLAAKTLAEGVMRSLKFGVVKVWLAVGLLGLTLAGGGLMLAGGPREPGEKKVSRPGSKSDAKPDGAKASTVWKENYTADFPAGLPVSVAFSGDGKTLLVGDTGGEVTSLLFTRDDMRWRWKQKVGGSHAVVAFSADWKKVYATTEDGVRILDSATGKEEDRLEAKGSGPISLGVFPDKTIAVGIIRSQVVFGNARGYFVKSWVAGKIPSTVGTIETSTVAKGVKPADTAAVPLAVDPKGRSAIMTGPRDSTGKISGTKGKNVLWAYVCGDYSEGSPGNRPMIGHTATVVTAAWAKEGGTSATGDDAGRVIVWDAKAMKETRRVELGGRIMALALSDDGSHAAAYVRTKRGGDVFVWEIAKPVDAKKPIHSRQADLGTEPFAGLAFSPDGKRLAGCAIDKAWLRLPPAARPSALVRVWDLAAEPKAQPAPRRVSTKRLPKGSSTTFVILDDHSILTTAPREGAIDLREVSGGEIQARLGLGKFTIGGVRLSSDRKWLAIERRPITNGKGVGIPSETFEVGVYESPALRKAVIPSCSRLLAVASGGKCVAVVREKRIELWDTATAKKLKAAPFESKRIDAAEFSPDGKLLAVSDSNALVLWRWEDDAHERIDLGRRVGSLAFSPDGKFLAEGPTPGGDIQIRDLETRKVVKKLANGTKRPMNVPRMAFTQGGRVLIACDDITPARGIAVPHRITLWDTESGSVVHQNALPAGLPTGIDVTPNGRYAAAMLDEGKAGVSLSVWRLDGEKVEKESVSPPASAKPR